MRELSRDYVSCMSCAKVLSLSVKALMTELKCIEGASNGSLRHTLVILLFLNSIFDPYQRRHWLW